MKHRFFLFAILSLIGPAGCGRGLDPNPGKKPIVENAAVRKAADDPKGADAPALEQPLAKDDAEHDANIKEHRQAAEKLQGRLAAIDHEHNRTFRQPAPELQHHLPSPVGQGLVTTLPLLIIAFGKS